MNCSGRQISSDTSSYITGLFSIIVVLDLASEIKPQWGDPDTPSKTPRPTGYDGQDWLWCMLLNFGGNVGLHGRLDNVIGGYYKARDSRFGKDMTDKVIAIILIPFQSRSGSSEFFRGGNHILRLIVRFHAAPA